MRKVFTLLCLLGVAGFVNAQTLVSTQPENKNVVLEEFTGIHCGYCPQGHAIAKGIQDAHPSDVILINVHTGSFASPSAGEPDFRTPWGPALDGQSNLTGYPAGTVNRHVFPGQGMSGGTAMSRSKWAAAASTILGQNSYVNVGVAATVDSASRVLTVQVEAYYTGNSPQTTNKLNVALLQNHILGPQSGGNMGNNYVHMHMLRDFLTGQWGETIDTTTQGYFLQKTYIDTLPADINGVPLNIEELEVAAYIAEGNQEIISGQRCFVIPSNADLLAKDANLDKLTVPAELCITDVKPKITFLNEGLTPLNAVNIDYSINGGQIQTYNWTGSLSYKMAANIELPVYSFNMQSNNNVEVNIVSVNGSMDLDTTNNKKTAQIQKAEQSTPVMYFELKPDDYGSETTWKLLDENGTVKYSGGPYQDNNNTVVKDTFELTSNGCYTFEIYDAYGDGINSGYGVGYYKLWKSDNTFLINGTNFTTEKEITPFEIFNVGVGDNIEITDLNVYPNPVNDQLFVELFSDENQTVNIEVYNTVGKLVKTEMAEVVTGNNQIDLNVSKLTNGVYFVKINLNGKVAVERITKH